MNPLHVALTPLTPSSPLQTPAAACLRVSNTERSVRHKDTRSLNASPVGLFHHRNSTACNSTCSRCFRCSPPALAASSCKQNYSLQVVFVEMSVHTERHLNNRETAKYSKKIFTKQNIYTLETFMEKLCAFSLHGGLRERKRCV